MGGLLDGACAHLWLHEARAALTNRHAAWRAAVRDVRAHPLHGGYAMKKTKTENKFEVIKKGTGIKEIRPAAELQQVAAARMSQLGCGGAGQCIA
jgi:hypothetical protein